MINILKLNKEDVGKWVEYSDELPSNIDNPDTQKGRIKSWNKINIFVVYKCDGNWDRFQDYTGCATSPEDLVFI